MLDKTSTNKHPWVEDYKNFEAVFICTNELRDWEAQATMRAFQTYQWHDATTNGDERSFSHNESGTLIRQEGSVVAIDYGADPLTEALPDLFMALSALGWVSADLYCMSERLDDILADIGRSIPANLNFDVKPAKIEKSIADTAIGRSLIESATGLGNKPDAENTILSAVRDLGNAAQSRLTLIDDDDSTTSTQDDDHIAITLSAPTSPSLAPALAASTGDIDDKLPVFKIPDEVTGAEAPKITAAAESEAMTSAPGAQETAAQITAQTSEPVRAAVAAPAAVELQTTSATPKTLLASNIEVEDINSLKIIKVGQSILAFDYPGDPLMPADIDLLARKFGISLEQHVYPGSLKSPIRWDVLGEISDDYPFYTEKLVGAMNYPSADPALIAGIILALKKEKPYASLRDLLMFAGKDKQLMSQTLKEVSPAAETLLTHAEARGELEKTLNALVQRLGMIALAADGECFVDVIGPQDVMDDKTTEMFTIRETVKSPTPRLMIFHIDEMDGPFIVWIAALLQFVAHSTSTAKRYFKEMAVTKIHSPISSVASEADPAVSVFNALREQLNNLEEAMLQKK